MLVLWGARSQSGRNFDDIPSIWKSYATDVCAASIDCGHFLAEEAPDEAARSLIGFFQSHPVKEWSCT
jgi:haloacetate dehalogenase